VLVLSLLTPTLLLSLLFNDRRYCRRRRRREMISSIDIFEVLNSSNIVRKCSSSSSSSSSFSPPLISLRAPFCFNRLCTNRSLNYTIYSATTVAQSQRTRAFSISLTLDYIYRYMLCCRERFSTRFTPLRTTFFFYLCGGGRRRQQTTVRFSLLFFLSFSALVVRE